MVEGLWRDLKLGARMLAKSPSFTLVAIVSIAIGVGANAAMFSMADGLVMRPLAVPQPGGVLTVVSAPPGEGLRSPEVSYADYTDIRGRSRSFATLTAYQTIAVSLQTTAGEMAQRRVGVAASDNLFDVAGIRPALGRWFRADENRLGEGNPVVVLDHDTWTEQFGADPAIIDRRVRLSGIEFTIVGVAPDGFTGIDSFLHPAFYVPLAMVPALGSVAPAGAFERRDVRWLRVKGRLAPGVSMAQAREEVSTIAADLERLNPASNRGMGFGVKTELEARSTYNADVLLVTVLMTLAFAVLLVACANVAGLLMSQAPERAREMALRLAIGAGRPRVIRQLVTESLLLALGGGALGLLVAYAGITLFRQIEVPSDIPGQLIFELDGRVLLVGITVALFSALVSSLLPAWRTSRTDLVAPLKGGAGLLPRPSRLWGRHTLVCSQIALTLVLVAVSVWLYRGYRLILTNGPGYRTDHVLMMSFDPNLARYDESQAQEFFSLLRARVLAVPGVKAAGLTSDIPLSTGPRDAMLIAPEGHQFPSGTDSVIVQGARIDEGYFTALALPLVSGRSFQATDTASAPSVAIVNTALARRYWGDESPIGKRIHVGEGDHRHGVEIVGVASTIRYNWVAEGPTDFLYLPREQEPEGTPPMTLLVHTRTDAASVAPALLALVRGLDSNMPAFGVRTLDDFYRARALTTTSVIVRVAAGMGITGLMLSLIGLYALVAYSVNRRRREIGIRIAVGARPATVLAMVMRHGLLLSVAGIGTGLLAALGMNSLLRAAFPISSGLNPVVFVIVVPMLLAVTLAASLIPARRAARIDPMSALRQE